MNIPAVKIRAMTKKIKILTFSAVAVVIFAFLPQIPVAVVPEVTLKVVGETREAVAGVTVTQFWQHWTFESEEHKAESVSNANGYVTFTEKKIWVSPFRFLTGVIAEHSVGKVAIHAGSGPSVDFGTKGYKSEVQWCYPEWRCKDREISKIIVIKEVLK